MSTGDLKINDSCYIKKGWGVERLEFETTSIAKQTKG
jgi:hypothetical protein